MQEPIDDEPPLVPCRNCGDWTDFDQLKHNSGWCQSCVNDSEMAGMEIDQETRE